MWDLDGNENIALRLRSPGISVCWHPEEAFKVGVAPFATTNFLRGVDFNRISSICQCDAKVVQKGAFSV